MENIGETIGETEHIGENIDETNTSIIEKPKKPQKKRETQSTAQLETLKKGREKLAEKRQKQREAKKQSPMDELMHNFEMKCNDFLNTIESKVNNAKFVPNNIPEPRDTKETLPPKIQKFFV